MNTTVRQRQQQYVVGCDMQHWQNATASTASDLLLFGNNDKKLVEAFGVKQQGNMNEVFGIGNKQGNISNNGGPLALFGGQQQSHSQSQSQSLGLLDFSSSSNFVTPEPVVRKPQLQPPLSPLKVPSAAAAPQSVSSWLPFVPQPNELSSLLSAQKSGAFSAPSLSLSGVPFLEGKTNAFSAAAVAVAAAANTSSSAIARRVSDDNSSSSAKKAAAIIVAAKAIVDEEKKLKPQPQPRQSQPESQSQSQSQPQLQQRKKRRGGSEGRRGDPRMHGAVALRMANPKMPLIEALLKGGFVFPTLGEPGANDRNTLDQDGALLYQRKNQLNRRLRLAKKKADKEKQRGKKKGNNKKHSSLSGASSVAAIKASTTEEEPSCSLIEHTADDDDEQMEEVMEDDFLGFLDPAEAAPPAVGGNLLTEVFDDDDDEESSSGSHDAAAGRSPYQSALDLIARSQDIVPIPL